MCININILINILSIYDNYIEIVLVSLLCLLFVFSEWHDFYTFRMY